MSSKWNYELSGLQVVVEGRYYPGENFVVTSRTIQPPDPAKIEIKHVWLVKKTETVVVQVDLLPALPDEIVAEIEVDLLEGEL